MPNEFEDKLEDILNGLEIGLNEADSVKMIEREKSEAMKLIKYLIKESLPKKVGFDEAVGFATYYFDLGRNNAIREMEKKLGVGGE